MKELKNFMTVFGLTNAELAKTLGLSNSAVTHWLTGIRNMPKPVLAIIRYCKKNGVDIRDFKL